jgi:hypothetical protein
MHFSKACVCRDVGNMIDDGSMRVSSSGGTCYCGMQPQMPRRRSTELATSSPGNPRARPRLEGARRFTLADTSKPLNACQYWQDTLASGGFSTLGRTLLSASASTRSFRRACVSRSLSANLCLAHHVPAAVAESGVRPGGKRKRWQTMTLAKYIVA